MVRTSLKICCLLAVALTSFAVYSRSVGTESEPKSVEIDKHLQDLIETKIVPLLRHPGIIDAIKLQNQRNSRLQQGDIEEMDREYIEQVKKGDGPILEKLLERPISRELKKIKKDNKGVFTEIFVMDNRGLNVGQSDPTSDYWQGDEAKWQRTYLLGPSAVYVGVMDFDDSTQKYQIQVSATISEKGVPIGAVTFGVDPENF